MNGSSFFFTFGIFFFILNNIETDVIWGITLIILFISVFTSFDFIFRPFLLRIQANLYEEEGLSNWLRDTWQLRLRVYSYQGELVNAFATGAVPFSNTIILGQRLIDNMDDQSLKAITLHEAGHLRLNHLFYLFMINIICTSLFCLVLYNLFNMHITPEYFKIIILVVIAAISSSLIFNIIPGYLMKYFELQADRFSAQKIGGKIYKEALMRMDVISEERVSRGGFSHPTLEKRIENIMAKDGKKITGER